MKTKLILILLILLSFSCRSIKRDKNKVKIDEIKTERIIDNTIKRQNIDLEIVERNKETVTETVVDSHEVFNVNGEQVLKPVKTTTKITKKDNAIDKIEVKKEVIKNDIEIKNDEKVKVDSVNIIKEVEGRNVLKDFTDAVFDPTTKKILAFLVIIALIIIFMRISKFFKL